jgi:NTP pyrophosphatase (non-canonical NTP hydrolase)
MTDAEKERLYMLAEEAAEVIQMVNKILRHGYDSYHPFDLLKTPNSVLLQQELTDLLCVVDRMNYVHDIDVDMEDTELLDKTWQKKLKYTRYQK